MIKANTAKSTTINARLKQSAKCVTNITSEISKNIISASKQGANKISYTIDKMHPHYGTIQDRIEKELESAGYKVDLVGGSTITISW